MILVDTSVWIDYFNTHASDEAAYLTLCIAEARDLVVPGLVLTEILLGAHGDIEAARISRVMSAFDLRARAPPGRLRAGRRSLPRLSCPRDHTAVHRRLPYRAIVPEERV